MAPHQVAWLLLLLLVFLLPAALVPASVPRKGKKEGESS